MRHLLLGLLLFVGVQGWSQNPVKVLFWNVENYFDPRHDTSKLDEQFTPEGELRWTWKRFYNKRNGIAKVIAAASGTEWQPPVIVGLAEVENDYTLYTLCSETPLRKLDYKYIHFESPDRRGIDCALLYRSSRFTPFLAHPISISDTSRDFYSRDLLIVGGRLDEEDSIYLIVCHLPSKLGGFAAGLHRKEAARILLHTMDTLQAHHPEAGIVVMGDFNMDSHEAEFQELFGMNPQGENPQGWKDLLWKIPKGTGSYKYHGLWNCIDHVISNIDGMTAEVFAPKFLLADDKTYHGLCPFRTYHAYRYQGGFSDHLPVLGFIPRKSHGDIRCK